MTQSTAMDMFNRFRAHNAGNTNKTTNGDNSNTKGETESSSSNTNLLNGGTGDSVTKTGNPELAKLNYELATKEGYRDYLKSLISTLTNDDEKKAKQAQLDKIEKQIEDIKAKIEDIKTKEAENSENSIDIENLSDEQKAELIKEKDAEIKELEAQQEALIAEQTKLSNQLHAEQAKPLPDKQLVRETLEKLPKIGAELNDLREKISKLKADIAKLQGTTSSEKPDSISSSDNTPWAIGDGTEDTTAAENTDAADKTSGTTAEGAEKKAEIEEKIKQLEEQYQKLLEERRSLANGTLTFERGPMGIMRPVKKYSDDPTEDARIKQQIAVLDLNMRLIQTDIARLKVEAAGIFENIRQSSSFGSVNSENSSDKSLSDEEIAALKEEEEKFDAERKAIEEQLNAYNNEINNAVNDNTLWALGGANGNSSVNGTNSNKSSYETQKEQLTTRLSNLDSQIEKLEQSQEKGELSDAQKMMLNILKVERQNVNEELENLESLKALLDNAVNNIRTYRNN